MSAQTLLHHADILFSYPQHNVVLSLDHTWAFVYTFNDDMYFESAGE